MTTMDPSASASVSGGNASGHKALWAPWAALWNGDLDQTGRIIAPDFVAHAAPITGVGPEEMHGRGTLRGWIGGARAAFPDMRFETKVGPFADGDFVIGRWQARGTYVGGIPGASDEAVGAVVSFTGTDIWRVAGGLIAEYWANADSLSFMQQIGAVPTPRP